VSTFYAADANVAQEAIKAMFTTLNPDLPSATAITVAAAGDIIRDTDGQLVGGWVGDTLTPQGGGDTGGYNAAAGFQIKWLTAAFLDGSRVVGRTYFVPASRTCFDTAGNVIAATRTRAAGAGSVLAFAVPGNLCVWRRPRAAVPAWTGPDGRLHPAIAARAGVAVPITGCEVPAKAVVLRSRRD
jgi:hypothetical protein